jgi:hypothetical protein
MKKCLCLLTLFLLFTCWYTEGLSRSELPRPSATSNHSFCGTYPGRVYDELRKAKELHLRMEGRRDRLAISTRSSVSGDIGNIAIIEDDGTLVSPANPFDLAGQVLKAVPAGTGTYTLNRQTGNVNQNLGTRLPLTDDDFRQIAFPAGFQFPFFGTRYGSVFINSDGNITFAQGDAAHSDRNLSRFNGGMPRIAVIFEDLDPTVGDGGVYYNALPDRFLITWERVREYGGTQPNTAQLALFPDGSFELTYGTVTSLTFIVGWSPGQNLQSINLVDFSTSAGTLPPGPTAESYTGDTNIDFTAVAKNFYQTHPDSYDQLAIYTNFRYALGGEAFAYEITLKNDIQGIHLDLFDFSQEFGSAGRLSSYLALNQLSVFPDNPDAIAVRTYSTVGVLAHETAHRWLAYPFFKAGTTNSGDLLGYQQAHWNFFFDADASLMEGHLIQDNGDGTFAITAVTDRFGKLDQYLMGLRSASDVGPLFYVRSATGTDHVATDVSEPSDVGLTFGGTRTDLSVFDIISAEGPRIPDVTTASNVFHQATILLVRQGTSPSAAEIDKLTRIQQRFQQFYSQASDGLAIVDISLNATPAGPIISGISPASGSTLGNTRVYISGSNFENGAAVTVGTAPASNIQVVNQSLIIATTGPGSAGAAHVTVTNPGSQAVTLPNAYTYRAYAPVTVSSTALRVPDVVDTLFFRSNLGIDNPTPLTAHVRISQLDSNGLLVTPPGLVSISPNGYLQINSVLRFLEGATTPTGREGSLVLESDQLVQAFVSQIDNQSNDPSLLDGTRSGATRLILQSAANTGRFQSSLLVLNLSSSQAVVDIAALGRDTGQPIGVPLRNLAITGNGFVSYDNILQALSLPGSYGPIEIRSTNGAMLAAVSRVSGVNAGTSGFFAAQPEDSGSQSQIIPFVIDTDAFRTNLGLNNLGTGITNIQISLIGEDGATRAATAFPIQVAPLGLVQINNIVRFLINGSGGSSVANQQGYLLITADQPIKAYATQIDNTSDDPSIEDSASRGSSHLLLKSSANMSFQSTLVIVNPNDSAVTVTVNSRQGDTTGNGSITGSRFINIAAKGYYASSNILRDIGATSAFGPIEILSTAGSPVMAVSRVYSASGHTSGFFSLESLPQ